MVAVNRFPLENCKPIVSPVTHPYCLSHLVTFHGDPVDPLNSEITANSAATKECFSNGVLGEGVWQQSEHTAHLSDTPTIKPYNGYSNELLSMIMSGSLRLEDVISINKNLKECKKKNHFLQKRLTNRVIEQRQDVLDETTLAQNNCGRHVRMRLTSGPSAGETNLQRIFRQLKQQMNLTYYTFFYAQDCSPLTLGNWNDRFTCGYTLSSEINRLCVTQLAQKKKEKTLREMHGHAVAEKEAVEEDLQKAEIRLTQLTRMTQQLQWEVQEKSIKIPTSTTNPNELLKDRLENLEAVAHLAAEKLIENQMHREIDEVKAKMVRDGLERRVRDMADRLELRETEIKVCKDKIKTLITIQEDLQRNAMTLRTKINDLEEKIKILSGEKRALETRVSDIKQENNDMSQKIVKLNITLSDKENENVKNESEIRVLNHTIKELEGQLDQQKKQENQLNHSLEINKMQLTTALSNVSSMKSDVEILTDKIKRQEMLNTERIKEMELDKKLLQQKLKVSVEETESLKITADSLTRQLVNEKESNIKELNTVKALHQRAVAEHDILNNSIATMRQQSEDANKQIKNLIDTNVSKEREIQKIQMEQASRTSYNTIRNKEIRIFPRMRTLTTERIHLEFEKRPMRHIPIRQKTLSISIRPKHTVLKKDTGKLQQKIYIPKEEEPPVILDIPKIETTTEIKTNVPKSVIAKQPPPKETLSFIGRIKPSFTSLQQKILSGAEDTSRALLKRKPTADELAAVAVSGAEQNRRGNSSILSSPSLTPPRKLSSDSDSD